MKRQNTYLAAVLMLAGLVRVFHLGHFSMWFDEAASWRLASFSISRIVELARIDNTPPLYHIILHFWLKTGASSDFAVKIPALIFGWAAVYMTFKLGGLLFDRQTALFAALVGALSFPLVHYSQENRMYSLQVLLALIHIFYFVKGLREGGLRHWIVWLISGILMYYNHLFAVFLFIAEWVYFLASLKAYRGRWKSWTAANALLAAACAPWIPVILRQMGAIQERYWVQPVSFPQLFKTAVNLTGGTDFNGRHLLALALNLPFWTASAAGIYKLMSGSLKDRLLPPILFLTPFAVVLAISLRGSSLFFFRYFIFLVPLLHLIMVYGLLYGFGGLKRVLMAGLILASLIIFLIAYYTVSDYSEPQRLNTRQAVHHIQESAGAEDVILHIAIHNYGLETFFVSTRYNRGAYREYIWRSLPLPFYFGRQTLPEGSKIDRVDVIADAPRIWVVSQGSDSLISSLDKQLPRFLEKRELFLRKYKLTLDELWEGLGERGYSLESTVRFDEIILYEFIKSEDELPQSGSHRI